MDIWSVLGISPTTDKSAITAAYHAKLPEANPEDAPEAFKALRSAYEQALKFAAQAAAPDREPETPAELWSSHLNVLYQDIATRRDAAAWQDLLAEDFSFALITRVQARDVLLRYLMNHYFLPRQIWEMLDNFFSLQESAEDLYQSFPRDFIDNAVFAGIRNDELLPYALLEAETGEACDTYLLNYSRCRNAISAGQQDSIEACLETMRNSGVQHPYTLLCEARLAILNNDHAHAQELALTLLSILPQDPQCLLLDGQLAIHDKDFLRAEKDMLLVIDAEPELAQAQFDLAASLCGQDRYIEAKEIYLKLHRLIPYNHLILDQVDACNKHILPEREARMQENPEDADNILELAWCYHQDYREEDARKMLVLLPQEMHGGLEYENLASKVYLGSNDMPAALEHLLLWEKAIRAADESDTAAKSRLPESQRLQAVALSQMHREPEADALLQQVSHTWPEDAATWQFMVQRAIDNDMLDRALDYAAHLRETAPGDPYSHYISGVILFKMGRMQEAFNCFNAAMQRSGRDASCLLYQARIFIGAGQWDDAQKILDDLTFAKVECPELDYCLARMAAHNKDLEQAETLYLGILPACRDTEDPPDFAGEVFYRLICLQYKTRDKNELLALADEGLSHDEGSLSLMDLKGDLLRELNRIPEAVSVYEEICRRAPKNTSAYESLGRLYQFCIYDYAKAAQQYELQLKNSDTAVVHNLLALCYQELARYPEAEQHFLVAAEKSPKEFSYRSNLAELYLLTKQYEKAEAAYRDALACPIKRSTNRVRLRRQLARLYWRMGRNNDAADTIEENITMEFYYADLQTLSDGWAKAGDFTKALAALERWKKLAHPAEGLYCVNRASLLLAQGRTLQAEIYLLIGAQTDRGCARRLAALYAETGRYAKALSLFHSLAKDAAAKDENSLLEDYARCLMWAEKKEEAARVAQQGLAALKKKKSHYNPALYHTQEAMFFIFAGDLAAAETALTAALHSPMCSHCYHCACKDALLVRILLEERKGNSKEALRLCTEGRKAYPDEEDFLYNSLRLTKRMKKA